MSLFSKLFGKQISPPAPPSPPKRNYSALPSFIYHPEPLATGSIEPSEDECICCGEKTGYIYTGPVYAKDELDEQVCPWCIADGFAHKRFDAEFSDATGIGGGGQWDSVPDNVIQEICLRTPGFSGWQQEQWWTHCGDAAIFIGRAGKKELEALGSDAIEAILDSTGLTDD